MDYRVKQIIDWLSQVLNKPCEECKSRNTTKTGLSPSGCIGIGYGVIMYQHYRCYDCKHEWKYLPL